MNQRLCMRYSKVHCDSYCRYVYCTQRCWQQLDRCFQNLSFVYSENIGIFEIINIRNNNLRFWRRKYMSRYFKYICFSTKFTNLFTTDQGTNYLLPVHENSIINFHREINYCTYKTPLLKYVATEMYFSKPMVLYHPYFRIVRRSCLTTNRDLGLKNTLFMFVLYPSSWI